MTGRSRARDRSRPSGAAPAVSVYLAGGDFSTDTVGALASVRGFTFARASTATTYDEAAGTVTTGVGVDTARAAKSSAGRVGLLIEPVRTNLLVQSQDPTSGWTTGGTVTRTRPYGTGPDGSTVTPTRVEVASGSSYVYRSPTLTINLPYIQSSWIRATDAGDSEMFGMSTIGGGSPAAGASPGTTSWKRRRTATASPTATAAANVFAADGRGNTLFTGVSFGATALDQVVDYQQVEQGRWASSAIPTTAATVTRAADKLSVAESTVEAAGALRFYVKIEMPTTLLNHVESGGTGELTLWTDAAGSYKCWIDASSGAIYAQALASDLGIPAAVYTTSAPVSVAIGDLLEVWVVCGGAALPTIKYRINAGSVVTPTLSSGTRTHTLPTIGATVHVLGDSTGANGLYGTVQTVAFYADGQAPGGF